VGEEQERFTPARAAQARHQVALALMGHEDLDVGLGEPRRHESAGHGPRRGRVVALRSRGVDLHELPEDREGELGLRIRGEQQGGGQGEGGEVHGAGL
jgi:hypothetical protein